MITATSHSVLLFHNADDTGSESIRSAIISKHKTSKGYEVISKNLDITVLTVYYVIKKFTKQCEKSSKVGANCVKHSTQNVETAEG